MRKDYKKKREAAILLQAYAMGLHARGHAENMKSDVRKS